MPVLGQRQYQTHYTSKLRPGNNNKCVDVTNFILAVVLLIAITNEQQQRNNTLSSSHSNLNLRHRSSPIRLPISLFLKETSRKHGHIYWYIQHTTSIFMTGVSVSSPQIRGHHLFPFARSRRSEGSSLRVWQMSDETPSLPHRLTLVSWLFIKEKRH